MAEPAQAPAEEPAQGPGAEPEQEPSHWGEWEPDSPFHPLQFLDSEYWYDEGPEPDMPTTRFHGPEEYLESLQDYLQRKYQPEALGDLQSTWDFHDEPAPSWMYLAGKDPKKHLTMDGWGPVLMRDLQCDYESCKMFQELLNWHSPLFQQNGYMEGVRILSHMLKDKWKEQDLNSSWSGFLKSACREAREALEAGDHWWTLHMKGRGKGKEGNANFGACPAPAPGPAPCPKGKGKGNDPGFKGQGKGDFHKGFR